MKFDSPASKPNASSPPRRRNAAATREAILRSALIAFTRSGYDGVGVREIAQAAGVTAMLVNRYFGSKEQLFAEVVEAAMLERTVLTHDAATLSHDVAVRLTARTAAEAAPLDPFLLMLRSASNERAAEILRAGIERHVEKHLVTTLSGSDVAERSSLFLSIIAGVWLMRKVLGSTALTGADPTALSRRLEALFQLLVEPDPARAAETARAAALRSPAKRASKRARSR